MTTDPRLTESADRPRVAVVFGGQSSEHSISCLSARGILDAIDRSTYGVVAIGIDRGGAWRLVSNNAADWVASPDPRVLPEVPDDAPRILVDPAGAIIVESGEAVPVDVLFPVLHGKWGEDGTIQGLCELLGLPYVGSGVLSSALCMDKLATKRALESAGIDVGTFVGATVREWDADRQAIIDRAKACGFPCFVKPARAGSSMGVTKVHRVEDLESALAVAFRHDSLVIVEAAVSNAREIECGVLELGESAPQATQCAEIRVVGDHEFYDFEAKYLDGSAQLIVPADLDEHLERKIQEIAITAFGVLSCAQLARVDFFVDASGRVVLNEVNTMPGFTEHSLFPRMCQHSGWDYSTLVAELLDSAVRRGVDI